MTLVINCTEDLKTAPSKPPQYRCHRAPMREYKKKGKSERSRNSVRESGRIGNGGNGSGANGNGGGDGENVFTSQEEILETFTAVCDFMDWERSHQDKVPLSDYLIKSKHATIKYTGPVDSKGRPKVPYKEIPKPAVMTLSSSHKDLEEAVGSGGNNQSGDGITEEAGEGQGIDTPHHITTHHPLNISCQPCHNHPSYPPHSPLSPLFSPILSSHNQQNNHPSPPLPPPPHPPSPPTIFHRRRLGRGRTRGPRAGERRPRRRTPSTPLVPSRYRSPVCCGCRIFNPHLETTIADSHGRSEKRTIRDEFVRAVFTSASYVGT